MLSVRLFGNGPIEVIGQTRAFPTGEADGEALQEFEGDTTEEKLCPGDVMLVRSYVNARPLVAGDVAPANYRNANAFAALPIKLRVKSCPSGLQNQTLFDVGRQIVMPGNVGIEVLAPVGFTTSRPTDIEDMVEYFVQVVACPAKCCYPPLPMLTFWRALLEAAEEDERAFIVPRGARRMVVCEVPAGIVAVEMRHQGRTIAVRPIASGDVVEVFGAADEVVFGPFAFSAGSLLVRWEVEG